MHPKLTLIAFACLLGLAACGGGDTPPAPEAHWAPQAAASP